MTPQPNRAQRRAMANGKTQAPPKVIALPKLLDEFAIFDFPQILLEKLTNGEIEAVQGVPVFYDDHGVLTQICPALSGWLLTWQRINHKLNANMNLMPLQRIHNKLNACMPISMGEVSAAKQTLTSMRLVFRNSDRQIIKEVAKTAQIAILMGAHQ